MTSKPMTVKSKSTFWTGFAVNTGMAVAVGFAAHTTMVGADGSAIVADTGFALSAAGQAQVLASAMVAVLAVPPLLACQMGASALLGKILNR